MPSDPIRAYLTRLSGKLGLDATQRAEISKELETHLEDSTRDHQSKGLSGSEARKKAVEAMGESSRVAREPNWVHGFGRYSRQPFVDALLGGIAPFALASLYEALQSLVSGLESIPAIAVVWLVALGVSIYALKQAVPAWTVTWLGLTNMMVLFFLYVGTHGSLSALGLGWAGAYGSAVLVTSLALFFSTYWVAKHHVELTLLFLLPLAVLYFGAGYQDVDPSHTRSVVPFIVYFGPVFASAYLLTRNRCPLLFGAIGLTFYTGLYFDIMAHNLPPLNASGLQLVGVQILIYIVPLLLVSSPAYFYRKKKVSS